MEGRSFRGLVLVGFMGSGKSSVGREIAGRLRVEFVDLDERIERTAGKSVREIFAERGEPAFREMERAAIREAVTVPGRVIATGGGAFEDPENRRRLKGYAPVVFLDVTAEAVLARIPDARSRPLLRGDSPEGRQEIANRMRERRPAYEQADWSVSTDGVSVSEVAGRILAWIGTGAVPGPARDIPSGEASG
ncbi:MAG: shikimate kinase [Deltaproteobacteria bacterium]